MRFALLSSIIIVALSACGGKTTDANPDSGAICPADKSACSQEGAQCSFVPANECTAFEYVTCTCEDGAWSCPLTECPKQTCNGEDIYDGVACSTKGEQCPAMVKPACVDEPIECTCDGVQFHCAIPDCPIGIDAGPPLFFDASDTE